MAQAPVTPRQSRSPPKAGRRRLSPPAVPYAVLQSRRLTHTHTAAPTQAEAVRPGQEPTQSPSSSPGLWTLGGDPDARPAAARRPSPLLPSTVPKAIPPPPPPSPLCPDSCRSGRHQPPSSRSASSAMFLCRPPTSPPSFRRARRQTLSAAFPSRIDSEKPAPGRIPINPTHTVARARSRGGAPTRSPLRRTARSRSSWPRGQVIVKNVSRSVRRWQLRVLPH